MAKEVKLEDLFRWNKSVDIKDRKGNVLKTVYVRVAGDANLQEAQNHALARSRQIRRKLRDEESLEYKALFADLESRSQSDLIVGIIASEGSKFRDEANEELGEIDLPDLPDDPTLEEREKFQEDVEKLTNNRTEQLQKLIEEKMQTRREDLNKKDVQQLQDIYKVARIESSCFEVYGFEFRSYCVYLNVFSDKKMAVREFSNYDAFSNTSSLIKRILLESYADLELSEEDLKN